MIDGRAFLADLQVLERDLQHETGEAMRYAVEEAERHAKTTQTFTDRSGTLRSAITSWSTTTLGEIAANAKYAAYQENGTGLFGPSGARYRIPGNPFLTFEWKGVPVSFRYVMHPGVKPTHFMQKAGEWGGVVLHDGLSAFTQDAIRRFNGKS